jgi:hypothetical protein
MLCLIFKWISGLCMKTIDIITEHLVSLDGDCHTHLRIVTYKVCCRQLVGTSKLQLIFHECRSS